MPFTDENGKVIEKTNAAALRKMYANTFDVYYREVKREELLERQKKSREEAEARAKAKSEGNAPANRSKQKQAGMN